MRTGPNKSTFTSFSLLTALAVLCLAHATSVGAQEYSDLTPSSSQDSPAYDPSPRYRNPKAFVAISYSMAFASGDLHAHIADMSPRGFDFSPMMLLGGGAYLGLSIGYNRFYDERPTETYTRGHIDVTGKVYRSVSSVGLAATGRYYFLKPGQIARPYGGLRVGAAFVNAWDAVADYSNHDSPVGFLLVPEAGVALRISRPLSALIGYQYHFTTASFGKVEHASYHALQAGFQISY